MITRDADEAQDERDDPVGVGFAQEDG